MHNMRLRSHTIILHVRRSSAFVNTLFVSALPFCNIRLVLALLLNVLYLSAECVLFLYWRGGSVADYKEPVKVQ